MEQLSRSLKSTLNAQVVKLKLTKKQGACLTVEIAQVSWTSFCGLRRDYYAMCILFQ